MLTDQEKRHILELSDYFKPDRYFSVDEDGRKHV